MTPTVRILTFIYGLILIGLGSAIMSIHSFSDFKDGAITILGFCATVYGWTKLSEAIKPEKTK